MTKEIYLILAVCVVVFLIVLALVIIKKTNYTRYKNFIISNSKTYKNLLELNKRYSFYNVEAPCFEHSYDNKAMYTDILPEDYLIYQLQFNREEIRKQITQLEADRELNVKYRKELKTINQIGEYDQPIKKLKQKKLVKLEREICNKNVIKPTTSYFVIVELELTNINGKHITSKRGFFDEKQISEYIRAFNLKKGTYYYDRNIWESICRVERGKVTNKMRFSIYRRDGYRCRICGTRGGAFNDLEIDHIKPIAKGGKSTYDNLQTLCHRCNIKKGTTYIK